MTSLRRTATLRESAGRDGEVRLTVSVGAVAAAEMTVSRFPSP